MCKPNQPIKSYELSISYNQSVLQANSVTVGNIFDNYQIFFNPGQINNGTIESIYNLIVGSGNTTSEGSLITISFTPIGTGNADIQLYNVGVTNETAYIPIDILNHNIEI